MKSTKKPAKKKKIASKSVSRKVAKPRKTAVKAANKVKKAAKVTKSASKKVMPKVKKATKTVKKAAKVATKSQNGKSIKKTSSKTPSVKMGKVPTPESTPSFVPVAASRQVGAVVDEPATQSETKSLKPMPMPAAWSKVEGYKKIEKKNNYYF